MIQAILFDLDGTLIDTEKLYRKYYKEAFKHFGYYMTDERVLSLRSLGRPYCDILFNKWFGDKLLVAELKKYRNKLMDDHIAKYGFEIKKGMKELLQWLHENKYKVVLTTACDTPTATFRLNKVDIAQYFDHIVCANDVKLGKPSPDTYLKAIQTLNLDAKQCIAVEDSPNGVKSATSAGLITVMIPDQTQPDKELLMLNIKVCKDGFELKELIKNWK